MKRYFSFFIITVMFLMAAVTSCNDDDDNAAFAVNFDSNGGSEVASQSVKKGDKVAKPADPTRPRYGFDGWYNSDFTNSWDFDRNTVVGNIILYAKWNQNVYTVTFNSNGGSEIDPQIIAEEEKATEPVAPEKKGCNFDGWYTDNNTFNNKWNFSVNTVTADVTLYAKWELITYTVTFNSNEGGNVAAQTVAEGEKAAEPEQPAKDGYDFSGWYTDDNTFTDKWDFDMNTVTADVTLYAKWDIIVRKFTVTFDSNGGSDVASQLIVEGEKAAEPVAPANGIRWFCGWYTDNTTFNTKWDFGNDVVTEEMTLYAKWGDLANILKGSSMEVGDEVHWLSYSYGGTTPLNVTFGYTDDKPSGGTGACVAFSGGAGSTRTYVYQAVEVEAGKRYRFTGQVKFPAGSTCIYIRLAISTSINPNGQMTPVVFETSAESSRWSSPTTLYDGNLQGSIFSGTLSYTGSQGIWTATTTGTVYVGFSVYACDTPQAPALYDDVKFELIPE